MQSITFVPVRSDRTERANNIKAAEATMVMVYELIDTPGWQGAGLTIAGTIRRVGDHFEIEFASKPGVPDA